ncbi:hypothetical protein A3197_21530 [Candidatus Thiodiazotropha endoloripes]|nr:hypothetical protein A3197_21530 [Candidatus Thiodiazotropha endoloripes]
MERAKLVAKIEDAFKGVLLGNGIGLYETEAIDNYANDKKMLQARLNDRDSWKKWTDVPVEVIEVSHSALCFVDAEGMRFLLPAFMKYAVMNYESSNSASIDSPIYALFNNPVFAQTDIDEYFNHQHYETFAKFLKFMVLVAGEEYVDSFCASQAYEKHWYKYDTDMA